MNRNDTQRADTELVLTDGLDLSADVEYQRLAGALDALGAAERAEAPGALTERLLAATVDRLGPPVLARLAPSAEPRTRGAWTTPLRAAAGLALAATLGVAVLAGRSVPAVAEAVAVKSTETLEIDVERWLAMSDVPAGDLAERASSLSAEATALGDSLARGTGTSDLWTEEGAL